MFKYLFFLFIIIIIYLFYVNKIRIKIKSFFHKGFVPYTGKYGVYCYVGKQGSGKTLSLTSYLLDNTGKVPIYANMRSLKGIDYTYIKDFNELLQLRDKTNCIIVYDEIFTALTRQSKIDTDILDFLSQMRKRKIIFLTTAQEWLEIPITLRRYCRYQIDCKLYSFWFFGILVKTFRNAELMKWSNEDNDYIAPIIDTIVSKTEKRVADAYDTFEQIGKFEELSTHSSNELLNDFEDQTDLSNADLDFWS